MAMERDIRVQTGDLMSKNKSATVERPNTLSSSSSKIPSDRARSTANKDARHALAAESEPLEVEGRVQVDFEPDVTLYVGKSDEDEQAFQALETAGISFRVVPSRRRKTPSAEWGGMVFKQISGVQNLANLITGISEASVAEGMRSMPYLFKAPDADLMQRMQKLRETELEQARDVMRNRFEGPGLRERLKHDTRTATKQN
jgi:hypothetical protein